MTYIVRTGDTLWSIAQRFGVTPQAIMLANGIINPSFIYVGQTLIIPIPSQPTPPTYPPTPPSTDLEQRVTRLERQYRQLERAHDQLARRVTRLEQGRTGSFE